jgi:hypothetical protein
MTVIRKHVGTGALTRPAVLDTAIQRWPHLAKRKKISNFFKKTFRSRR